MRSRVLRGGIAAALALTVVTACADGSSPGGQTQVVAGFYPLRFVAEQVGEGHVEVTTLAPPGTEPHDLELKPSQIGQIADADLVIYLSGFQPEFDEAIEQNAGDRSLDITTVTPLDKDAEAQAVDPHVWLDPAKMATITDAVAARLGEIDPAKAASFTAAADALKVELGRLDEEFTAGLKTCQRREIVTSHAAFGYLARRYELEQIALTGLTPQAEPTPQRFAEVAAAARANGATTVFYEPLMSPRLAETLAAEVGAKTAVLDPLESLSVDGSQDYFSVMRSNLKTLRDALGCV